MTEPVRQWREHTVTVDGVRIVADDAAPTDPDTGPARPPILVVHGFTGTALGMRDLALATPGRRVVCVDVVGHGRSDAPDDVDAYRMPSIVGQLAALLDSLSIPVVDLVGYSMGGRIALTMAASRPDRVASIVTIGASPGIADPVARAERRTRDDALAARIESLGIEAFVEHWETLPIFATQATLSSTARARQRAERLAQRPTGLANSLRGTGTGSMAPLWDGLAGLPTPMLAIAGAEDQAYVDIARRVERVAPEAVAAMVPGAGHAAHLEAPEVVRSLIAEFVTVSVPPRPRSAS